MKKIILAAVILSVSFVINAQAANGLIVDGQVVQAPDQFGNLNVDANTMNNLISSGKNIQINIPGTFSTSSGINIPNNISNQTGPVIISNSITNNQAENSVITLPADEFYKLNEYQSIENLQARTHGKINIEHLATQDLNDLEAASGGINVNDAMNLNGFEEFDASKFNYDAAGNLNLHN